VVTRVRPRRIAIQRGRADLVEEPREDAVCLAQMIERARAQGWPSTPPGTPVFVE
jgi:hypothetical protein